MLKNGVGRYNIFFNCLHIACWILLFVSFSYIICQCFYSSTIWLVPCAHFLHQQTISHMRKRFPEWVHCQVIYEYCAVNIECFIGCKRIKQRRISFLLGYLRMILWKISTAISIKHRILATFNIKIINSDSLYSFKEVDIKKWELYTVVSPVISSLLCDAIWNPREIYLYLILIRSFNNANMWKASLVVRVTLTNISVIS